MGIDKHLDQVPTELQAISATMKNLFDPQLLENDQFLNNIIIL